MGTASVWTHARTPGLVLGVVATSASAWALPPGWRTRFAFTTGWAVTLGYFLLPRGEGDYIIASDTRGYLLLGFGMVVLLFGIMTARPARPAPRGAEQAGT